MNKSKINLRGIVLTWTILTTAFFWTSTMRILLKPEISSWSIFGVGGKGFLGEFWLPPLILLFAIFLFYLEGRGRIRPLYHVLIISWHLLITGVIVYGSFQPEAYISFGTWGITLSFLWLVVPFFLFLVLTVLMVLREIINPENIPVFGWSRLNLMPLVIVAALFPVAYLFFHMGTGFNWLVKIAVASTIIQWILIIEAVGRPYTKNQTRQKSITSEGN